MVWIMNIFAFDLECLKNFFSAKFFNMFDKNDRYTFIISSEQNDSLPLIQFINQPNLRLVSYNGHHYDDLLLNAFLLNGKLITNAYLFKISKTIIETHWKEHPQWLKDLKWYNKPYESVDLIKLVSVNKSRPSLKSCGLHLKYPRIQDFSVDPNKPIAAKDIPDLLDYQDDDVLMTRQLYLTIEPDIKLREQMSERYDINILSVGDSGITDKMLQHFYGNFPAKPEPPKILFVKDLLPTGYKFKTKELLQLEQYLKQQKMYYPKYSFAGKNITVGKTVYNVQAGGLHSTEKARKFETDSDFIMRDADVTGYYVNLMQRQKIKPGHLTNKFLEILQMILDEREAGKEANDPVRRDGLKVVGLGFFGKMNFEPSAIYDPKAFFKVTIGGQIFLLSLIESLELAGILVVSGNTDGILCKIPRNLESVYYEVCEEWQNETGLKLEYTDYKLFVQKDVNNYMAVTDKGKLKQKGIFVDRLALTKRDFVYAFNGPIISLALHAYFKDSIEPEQTINNETDIYNFMFSQSTDRKYKTVAQKIKSGKIITEQLQKTNRWIITKNGYRLKKLHQRGGKDQALMKDCNVIIANDIKDVNLVMVDRQYYIDETWKIIYEIIGKPQRQMRLI